MGSSPGTTHQRVLFGYAANVDQGFSELDSTELEVRLRLLVVARSPQNAHHGSLRAKWLKPEVLLEVAFPNATGEGRLRHPSFKGFRDDLA